MSEQAADLESILLAGPWRMCFNPALLPDGGHKVLTFCPGGALRPANHHEASWRIRDGWLEFLEPGGAMHSRFFYHARTQTFYNDNDAALPCRKGQFMQRADT